MSLKEGYLQKWSEGKNTWHNTYCKLSHSGLFQWFDNASSISPKRSINIRDVWKFLAFDSVINNVPSKPSSVIASVIPRTFGIPHECHPSTRISWFMCPDETSLISWKNSMLSVVSGGNPFQSTPPSYQSTGPTIPPLYQPTNSSFPQQTGAIGFGMPDAANYGGNPYPYGPPPAYQQPPAHFPPPAYPQPPGQYGPPVINPTPPSYPPGTSTAYPVQPPPPSGQSTYYPPAGQGQYFVGQNGQPYQVVYVSGKPKKKKVLGMGNAALGLASGLAGGYLASRMFGGWGWGGGGLGMCKWGSWSSLSSFSWSD